MPATNPSNASNYIHLNNFCNTLVKTSFDWSVGVSDGMSWGESQDTSNNLQICSFATALGIPRKEASTVFRGNILSGMGSQRPEQKEVIV